MLIKRPASISPYNLQRTLDKKNAANQSPGFTADDIPFILKQIEEELGTNQTADEGTIYDRLKALENLPAASQYVFPWNLPANDGAAGQAFVTDGARNLSFADVVSSPAGGGANKVLGWNAAGTALEWKDVLGKNDIIVEHHPGEIWIYKGPPKTNLLAWYKADAITGLNDGDGVDTWPDSSGNGFHLTQATSGNRPIYKTNQINGLPAVKWTGNQYLINNSFASNGATPAAYSVWAIFKAPATNNSNRAILSSVHRLALYLQDLFGASNGTNTDYGNGTVWSGGHTFSKTFDNNAWRFFGWTHSGSSNDGKMYRDNDAAETFTGGAFPALSTLTVGAYDNGAGSYSQYFRDYITEILIYDETNGDTTISDIKSYCRSKFKLAL